MVCEGRGHPKFMASSFTAAKCRTNQVSQCGWLHGQSIICVRCQSRAALERKEISATAAAWATWRTLS